MPEYQRPGKPTAFGQERDRQRDTESRVGRSETRRLFTADRGERTSVQAPAEGQVIIDADLPYMYINGAWVPLVGGGTIHAKIISDGSVLATGDGQFIFAISDDLDGLSLVDADAYVTTVSSSGTPTIQIRNVTDAVDMLSTRITIDASEFTSYTAAAPPVINVGNAQVTTGDLVAIDVDVAGTGARGLGVILSFA